MSAASLYVVTGWPRSGTSAMMRLLRAHGIEPQYSEKRERLMQSRRPADPYLEIGYEHMRDVKWLRDNLRDGCAVKMPTTQLRFLPPRPMHLIWMHRDPDEIMASLRSVYPETDFSQVYPNWPHGYHETTTAMRELMEDRRSVLSITDVQQADLMRDPQSVARTLPFLRRAA